MKEPHYYNVIYMIGCKRDSILSTSNKKEAFDWFERVIKDNPELYKAFRHALELSKISSELRLVGASASCDLSRQTSCLQADLSQDINVHENLISTLKQLFSHLNFTIEANTGSVWIQVKNAQKTKTLFLTGCDDHPFQIWTNILVSLNSYPKNDEGVF